MTQSRLGLMGAAMLLWTGTAQAQERIIDADDPVMTFTVDGQEAAFEVTPDAPGSPVLSAAFAARLGLEGSMVAGVRMIGTTKLRAQSNLVRIDLGTSKPEKRRAFFFDTEAWRYRGDGILGPVSLPDPVITYRLRDAQEGEREVTLPLVEHKRGGFYIRLPIGDDYIPTFFTFEREETMANAAAGAMLAQAYGARMEGEARDLHIEFGIERPVRSLVFQNGFTLGELPVTNVVVRSQDTGSTAAIPDEASDPNEIVVAGGKAKTEPRLSIGTGSLKRCSSLSFDRKAEVIRLSCKLD